MLPLTTSSDSRRFQGLGTTFYRGSDAMILGFSIISRPSFDALDEWIRSFHEQAEGVDTIVICGMKSDLAAQRQVSEEVRCIHPQP